MDTVSVSDLKQGHHELLQQARKARENAYAPYSEYSVGAAIAVDGRLFDGQNIESVTFNGTMHAERLALMKAVSAGFREPDAYEHIAVTSIRDGDETPVGDPPCGHCLQILTQFVPEAMTVIVDHGDTVQQYTINELLPGGMKPESLL